MSASLLEMEKEVLEEGREWTRLRLEERLHGSEHLWSLAHHLYPQSKEQAAAWVTPLLHQLRHNPHHCLNHTLEDLFATNPADAVVNREVNYFQNHRNHLNYADLAARNAPIGSGSMESTCSQFQDRLKRRGQFWSPSGLAHMLAVDVAFKNDTLHFFWN